MNLVTGVLLAPITLPAKGIYYVFDKVVEQADKEFNDPARIRAALINLQHRLDAGLMTLERYEAAEAVLLRRRDAIEERRSAQEESERSTARNTRPVRRRRRRR